MQEEAGHTLRFTCEFDERTAFEVDQKGWFEGAVAVMPDGLQIAVSFWDPLRLSQELRLGETLGRSCFAEPGMIIVPKVTRDCMQKAIKELAKEKYFDRLIAMGQR